MLFRSFYNKIIFADQKLNQQSEDYLSKLSDCGIYAKPDDVAREFKSLMHTLSKPHHYFDRNMEPGLYVGGIDQAATAAAALCFLQFQREKYGIPDIFVIDEFSHPKCKLSEGHVICISGFE